MLIIFVISDICCRLAPLPYNEKKMNFDGIVDGMI